MRGQTKQRGEGRHRAPLSTAEGHRVLVLAESPPKAPETLASGCGATALNPKDYVLRTGSGRGAGALRPPTARSPPPGLARVARHSVGIFRTSQPSGGVSAREEEGPRPDGRMRLAPHVSIVTSSSAPPRDRASVAFGLGMKSCPRGELATTHGTRFPGPERPERLPALPVAPHRGQRRPRWIATARARPRADDHRDPGRGDPHLRSHRPGRGARLPAYVRLRST